MQFYKFHFISRPLIMLTVVTACMTLLTLSTPLVQAQTSSSSTSAKATLSNNVSATASATVYPALTASTHATTLNGKIYSVAANASSDSKNVSGVKKIASSPIKPKTIPLGTNHDWTELAASTQEILLPLKPVWNNLPKLQQRKWLAMVPQVQKMSTVEIQIIHQRMHDWALLSPAQRDKVRINFSKFSQLSDDEKLQKWQAYQALSPAEKASLMKKAVPPKGLALQNASVAASQKSKTPTPSNRPASSASGTDNKAKTLNNN